MLASNPLRRQGFQQTWGSTDARALRTALKTVFGTTQRERNAAHWVAWHAVPCMHGAWVKPYVISARLDAVAARHAATAHKEWSTLHQQAGMLLTRGDSMCCTRVRR